MQLSHNYFKSHTKHDFWLVAVENIFYTPSMLTIFGNQAEQKQILIAFLWNQW